mmetsp:Transcript_12126/g.11974  ORF Transcript_12126/g.11974 Transcript_12126/m.11974 type:complete len:342 (-) Transcript_12126:415-1440(-)
MHEYFFRHELRQAKFNPTTVILITVYTIDRTTNQTRTVGYAMINLFLSRFSLEHSTSEKDKDFILNEGNFQLPLFIQDPRRLGELRMEMLAYLEKVPCASLLVRINRAAVGPNGVVLSSKTVPQAQWKEKNIVVAPPKYEDSAYNTKFCRVSDVEMEVFPSRAERTETSLKDTAEKLMAALSNKRSANTNTLLDWLDVKLSVENEDPPILDVKYFATYDSDFGFKMAIDGLHNLPKIKGLFYVVIISINPPASLYTESKVPTNDVNLVATFDWESSVVSLRFLDNFFYYQNVKPDPSMTAIFDVRSIEFIQGIPKIEEVAWGTVPIFFSRFGNYYVRSGHF